MRGTKDPDFILSMINLPPADLKIVRRNGLLRVFDPLRKDYFLLTDEEIVRQVFVAWLIRDLQYPPSLLANEIGIRLNDTFKRCDTVLFSPDGKPLMIIEFKAPSVSITQETFDQIVRYNMALQAHFLIVSNGINHYCCKIDKASKSYSFLRNIPDYASLHNLFN